jgi:hypothetical protein
MSANVYFGRIVDAKRKLLQLSGLQELPVVREPRKRTGIAPRPLPGPPQLSAVHQVQVIWPPADDEQVLVVSECFAAADQVAGGPATAVAVTVTFADGRKP